MRKIRFILWTHLALGAGFVTTSCLWGQDGQLTLDPPLSEIFPLENLTDGVHLEYPVLVNDHMILRPNAILRFIFLDPNAATRARAEADAGAPGFHTHVDPGGTLTTAGNPDDHSHEGQAGGWGDSDGNDVAGIFDDKKDDAKRRKSELQTEIWRQKDLFDDALEHATELGTTVVYSLPPQDQPLLVSLDLPEGMLLGEIDGHVRVLGLKDDSRAYVGGIRPGDEIRSFNSGATLKTLVDFIREYSATKHQVKVTGNPNYAMGIWRPATSEAITVQIAAPPTIPSFLNDSYSSPVDQRH